MAGKLIQYNNTTDISREEVLLKGPAPHQTKRKDAHAKQKRRRLVATGCG
jgi:hypothetical protein